MGPFHHFGSLILISLGPYVNYGYFSEWVHVRFTDLIQQFATDSNECYDKLGDMGSVLSARTQAGSPGHYSITLQTTPVHSEHPAGERVQRAMRAVLNRINTMTITVASLSPR